MTRASAACILAATSSLVRAPEQPDRQVAGKRLKNFPVRSVANDVKGDVGKILHELSKGLQQEREPLLARKARDGQETSRRPRSSGLSHRKPVDVDNVLDHLASRLRFQFDDATREERAHGAHQGCSQIRESSDARVPSHH